MMMYMSEVKSIAARVLNSMLKKPNPVNGPRRFILSAILFHFNTNNKIVLKKSEPHKQLLC